MAQGNLMGPCMPIKTYVTLYKIYENAPPKIKLHQKKEDLLDLRYKRSLKNDNVPMSLQLQILGGTSAILITVFPGSSELLRCPCIRDATGAGRNTGTINLISL